MNHEVLIAENQTFSIKYLGAFCSDLVLLKTTGGVGIIRIGIIRKALELSGKLFAFFISRKLLELAKVLRSQNSHL